MVVSCSSSLEKAPLAGQPWPTLERNKPMALEHTTSKDCYVTQVDALVAEALLQQRAQSSLGGYEKQEGFKVDDQYTVAIKHIRLELVKVNRFSN